MDEPVCFVPDDRGPWYCEEIGAEMWKRPARPPGHKGYRRLEPGWLDAAVERVYAECWKIHRSQPPTHDEIRAALFPSEPEPEEWEREAADAWFSFDRKEERTPQTLARHFAKARRAREEKP